MTSIRRIILPILLLITLALAARAPRAAAQEAPGTFIPAACMFEGLDLGIQTITGEALGFECGYVVVPQRHADPGGPTLRLPVAIRRAPGGAPDPLFLAQGGPGGDAFEVFTTYLPTTSIIDTRDIVIFNQRGTPYAEPDLICPETEAILAEVLTADAVTADRLMDDAYDACYARLQAEGIDLSAFNSLENAADVPLIAQALGYDTFNFYGVSYGTLLGLHLMRLQPAGLRSVILDSVAPTDINFVAEVAASENRVYREVFAACAADAACAAAYPNLEERFFALVRQYDENPVSLTLEDPETGETYDAFLDGRGLRAIVHNLLYVPRMSAIFPKLVSDLERGDMTYLKIMWPLLVFDQLLAEGMYFSVVCAEDADLDLAAIPQVELRPEIAATAIDDLASYLDACSRWQVEQLPPSVDDPVVSDIPTLLLSGRFDPITPPAFATAAAASLSNATSFVDPTASHGVAFVNPCVNDIIVAFLDDPRTPPDGSCLAEQAPLTFVPPDAITLPLLAGVNSLAPRTLAAFGVAALLLLVVLSPFVVWPLVYIIRAFGDKPVARTPEDRRVRWLGRGLLLLFGVVAFVFAIGLLVFIVAALSDLTLATAMSLPPAAAPVLWLPLGLLLLALAVVATLVLLWLRRGTGSTAGKVYHTLVVLAAIALLGVIAWQGLLLPPL